MQRFERKFNYLPVDNFLFVYINTFSHVSFYSLAEDNHCYIQKKQ